MHLSERGSVLFLMPALVLVVVALGGITVDFAVVSQARNEASALAFAAANDAVGAGFDAERFRSGEHALDPVAACDAAADSVAGARSSLRGVEAVCRVQDLHVVVTVVARAELVFGRAVPGVDRTVTVRATTRSTPVVR